MRKKSRAVLILLLSFFLLYCSTAPETKEPQTTQQQQAKTEPAEDSNEGQGYVCNEPINLSKEEVIDIAKKANEDFQTRDKIGVKDRCDKNPSTDRTKCYGEKQGKVGSWLVGRKYYTVFFDSCPDEECDGGGYVVYIDCCDGKVICKIGYE
jgi:hypothetical protein